MAIPYISHLMSVSALVMENGGDEDQAIARLLHDGELVHIFRARLGPADPLFREFARAVGEIVG